MSQKCRVWWPKELASSKSSKSSSSSSSLLLFGWFVSCSPYCLDVVVAFAYDEAFLSHHSDSAIEEAIHYANVGMPTALQDKYRFAILGCMLTCENTDNMCELNMVDRDPIQALKNAEALSLNSRSSTVSNCRKSISSLYSSRTRWMLVENGAHSHFTKENCQVPTVHRLHWNGKIFSEAELHVIVYEIPRFGRHHFSVNTYSLNCTSLPLKRPKWVEKLYQKRQCIDLDTVILAINCSAAVNTRFDRELGINRYSCLQSMLSRPFNFIWRLWAAVVASISTSLYIVLQLLYRLAACGSKIWTYIALTDIFSSTWKNLQVRCFQILYWPIFLNDTGLRSGACVEYAEKAALRRHSLWSSVVVDVLLGNLVGFALLTHSETICKWISNLADHFTDDVLRNGCVWLMGVPAGFKLNMELAGFLGIISLNAIQIWSTLSASASYFCSYGVKVAALSGMLLGITIPAAFFTDMIAIAAFHVFTLHRLMSLLYSLQLQALTALWRLFRGRKWNPLRQRLDSYEYSVEQHIVGSLLFTPLLLLLPTISVFYMFFTIVNLTISFVCVLIEVIVSVIHATPYTEILLWLVRSRRFPSGIWFDIVCSQNASVPCSVDGPSAISSACKKMLVDQNIDAGKSGLLLSSLRSNFLTLGQVVLPHYRNICPGVNRPTIASSISGILMGKSISMTLAPEIPPKKPWMFISYKDYWRICYNAVLACMQP